jgi:alpha-L-fucosidase
MTTPTVTIPDGPFEPTWESLEKYQVPQWYQDAKFGIFIHWGVYSVPAFRSEWYPRQMYQEGSDEFKHHLATYGPHAKFGYKDFIPKLTAAKFDAGQWADLFHRAGAKFVVPVAEHHDGFAMYDCGLSKWNAVNMGPKRDIVGQLAAAVREKGMIVGVSSHRAEHWWFFDGGMKFDSDVKDPAFAGLYGPAQPGSVTPSPEFLEDWLARTCELVDKYRPLIVWFDWWIEQPCFKSYLRRFAAYYYNRAAEWGQGVAINYKNDAYTPRSAVLDLERGQLADIHNLFWQNDTAVGKNSWGYIAGMEYKTPAEVIGCLVDVVSKNGALLLNIGPRPDGTIPKQDQDVLLAIGKWLGTNGEAIYNTRPWKVYGEGPTRVEGGMFSDMKRTDFTPADIRFTSRGRSTLYAICLGKPKGEIVVNTLGSNLRLHTGEIDQVTMLGCRQPLKWTRDASGLRVKLPAKLPCDHAWTLKIVTK